MWSSPPFLPTARTKRREGRRDRRPTGPSGSILIFVALFSLLLMVIGAAFTSWMGSHRRHSTQTRFNTRSHLVLRGILDDARLRQRNAGTMWASGTAGNYQVKVGSETVNVQIDHFGFP